MTTRVSVRGVAMAMVLAGCARPRTQIMVRVGATSETAARVRSVHVVAQRESAGASPFVSRCFEVPTLAPPDLLGELGLTPRDESDATPVRIVVGLFERGCEDARAGAPLLAQEVSVRFEAERTKLVVMRFTLRCAGVSCPALAGCGAVTCQADARGASECVCTRRDTLPDWSPTHVSAAPPDDASVPDAPIADMPLIDGVAPSDVAVEAALDAEAGTDVSGDLEAAVDATEDVAEAGPDATEDVAEASPDAVPEAAACVAPRTLCGAECLDLQTTSAHCGACDRACVAGQTCVRGACACPTGQSECGGTCRDTRTDIAHCGGCSRACASGQRCADGACITLAQRSCEVAGTPGCGMVMVAGGTFTMGDAPTTYNGWPLQPSTRVSSFAIDAYEVTVARFRRWVAAGRPIPSGPVMYRGGAMAFEGTVSTDGEMNCNAAANYSRSDRENHPINCVNWPTAQAFCVWDGGRLPTQVEWEFAARGPSGRIYPWGSTPPNETLTCWSGSGTTRAGTCPVGAFPSGAVGGIYDLAGNVSEWNADYWAPYMEGGTGCWTGRATVDALCRDRHEDHLVRGAAWDLGLDPTYMRSAARQRTFAPYRNWQFGFRCARDAP